MGAANPARRAESRGADAKAGQRRGAVLQQAFSVQAIQRGEFFVHPAMQPDFMAAIGEFPHAFRMVQPVPAFDEEGALQSEFIQQAEQSWIADGEAGFVRIRRTGAAFADFPGVAHVVEGQAQRASGRACGWHFQARRPGRPMPVASNPPSTASVWPLI